MSQRPIFASGVTYALKGLIKTYTWLISPLLGPRCRFHPTCSAYALQALDRHGVLPGLWLMARRVGSCHPWSGRQGIDTVPDQFEWCAQFSYKRRNPDTPCKCKDETLTP